MRNLPNIELHDINQKVKYKINIMKTGYLLILFVAITSIRIYSQESKLLITINDSTFCINSTELKLGPLHLEAEMADVIEIMGQPDSIRIDSGLFDSVIHYYKGLIIYYIDDTVLGILADSDKYITPSGIHTGLLRTQVFKILGLNQFEELFLKDEIEFSACHNDDYLIQFFFDDSFILREIVVRIDFL